MSTQDNGGPAFPCPPSHLSSGITLRDYFAAAALTGLLSDNATCQQISQQATKRGIDNDEATSITAYEYADAMLAARNKQP